MCHACCKTMTRQSLWGFLKSCFNLFWKSVSCHRKSNYTLLCMSGLENSISFNMEMLLALTLPGSGVAHGGKLSRRSSLLIPAILACWTMIFPLPFLCLNLVFWWFADPSLASHINSNSMTRRLPHFSQHPLQPSPEMLTPATKGSCKLPQADSQNIISCWPRCYSACS